MLDNDRIKDFASKYGIYDFQIKSSYEHLSTVSLEMALRGFELLVADANGVRASDVPKINSMAIKPDEAIVLRYKMDALSYNDIYQLVKNIKETFHKNPLVALPNDVELMTMSTEELERIKNYIGDLILCSDFDGIVKAQKQISSARS